MGAEEGEDGIGKERIGTGVGSNVVSLPSMLELGEAMGDGAREGCLEKKEEVALKRRSYVHAFAPIYPAMEFF